MSINGDGSPQVIVAHQKGLGNDGQLWYNSFGVGSSWAGDQQVANVGMSVGPALLVEGDILYLFHQGSGNDGQLWYTSNDGFNGWTGDQQVPNTGMSESPAAAVYPGSGSFAPFVFHQGFGNDGQLWYNRYNGGGSWAGDQQVPNTGMSGSPALAVYGGGAGLLYVFHQGFGNDGQLWYNSYNGSSWTGDRQVPNTGMSGSPALAVYGENLAQNDTLYVFHQGSGNDGQLWYNRYNGSSWAGDRQVPNTGISGSPALAVYPPPGDSGPGDDAGGGGFPEPAEGDDPNAPKNPI